MDFNAALHELTYLMRLHQNMWLERCLMEHDPDEVFRLTVYVDLHAETFSREKGTLKPFAGWSVGSTLEAAKPAPN